MKPLIFVGHRYSAVEILLAAELQGYEVIGILSEFHWGNTEFIDNIPVIGSPEWLLDKNNLQAQKWLQDCDFFVCTYVSGEQYLDKNKVDNLSCRLKHISIMDQSGANVISIYKKDERILSRLKSKHCNLKIGKGVYISHSAVIEMTSGLIADYCWIGNDCNIGHDSFLHTNSCIMPHSKIFRITVGENSVIGMASMVKSVNLTKKYSYNIGNNSTVWAHSTIDQDVPDNYILTNTGRILKKQTLM